MGWLWWVVPFLLAAYLTVFALRAYRQHDRTWKLGGGMAVLSVSLGLGRLNQTESSLFYPVLIVEALLLGLSVYWIWRFDRACR